MPELPNVAEYFRQISDLSEKLEVYLDRIMALKEEGKKVTCKQDIFYSLYGYWSHVLLNSGELFPNLGYADGMLEGFSKVGATKTVLAIGKLKPLFDEMQSLQDESLIDDFLETHRDVWTTLESEIEDSLEFGQLLLAFSRRD